jgi:N-acyl-D-amino-acid deacylase
MAKLVLRGGKVVDGLGGPARAADVLVESDTIVAVGDVGQAEAAGAEEVQLDGLVLAPGFIDVHTHYDAQIVWDPDLTPSSWHGVTSVVTGNCGFSVAPNRPELRETLIRTLENVEAMSFEALSAGLTWSFETFPEYLEAVRRLPPRCNVGPMIGHSALRLYVLGAEAYERQATDEEIARMRALVVEAMEAGAFGFATSRTSSHAGDQGRPVPSRLATMAEITDIATALGDVGRGVVESAMGPGLTYGDFAAFSEAIGRPVTFAAVLTGMVEDPVTLLDLAHGAGAGEVWPQIACRPVVNQVTLRDPFTFIGAEGIEEVFRTPREARAALYADPAWRDRARDGFDRRAGHWWPKMTIQETGVHGALRDGPSVAEIAAQRQTAPFDTMVDLALEDGLDTRFRVVMHNDDDAGVARLLGDDRALLGLADSGAHASQMCDACFSSWLLSHWVRDLEALSLEAAVRRLTAHPAAALRIEGRGRLAPGYAADLVAFDEDEIGVEPLERVFDQPSGADRLVARSRGVEATWVNGVAARMDAKNIDGARAGRLLVPGP